MRALLATTLDSVGHHRAVVEAKRGARRDRLRVLDNEVVRRIWDLESAGPFAVPVDRLAHTCRKPECRPCQRRDLQSLWSGATQPLADLKAELWAELGASGNWECPYCGMATVDGFDHYLPQHHYPEYSATAENLVPACTVCNRRKRSRRPVAGARFLHPMFDPMDVRMLRCDVEWHGSALTAQLSVDRGAAAIQGVLEELEFHFDELRLADRFRQQAPGEIAAFWSEAGGTSGVVSRAGLYAARQRAAGQAQVYGENRWTALLFGAIADWIDIELALLP